MKYLELQHSGHVPEPRCRMLVECSREQVAVLTVDSPSLRALRGMRVWTFPVKLAHVRRKHVPL